ncbi:hypothetical protein, partial [Staphylococcus felis]|uniref:hypothetical protein n=1 Tax=Staphylococcus felis TaxID=46127 RepID=UPI000E36EF53
CKDTIITGKGRAGSAETRTHPESTTTTGTVKGEGRYEVKIPYTVCVKGGETKKYTLPDEGGDR